MQSPPALAARAGFARPAHTTEIVHIVLFKLKEQPDAAALASAKASVKKLEQVPGAISMFVGEPQIDARTKGYDYGLYAVFASRADLDKYDVSEAHKTTVAQHVRPNIQGEPRTPQASLTRRRHGVRLRAARVRPGEDDVGSRTECMHVYTTT